MFHGWSDMALSAQGTIDYFDQVLAIDETARDDVRLYLMPGVDHCFGGAGPSLVNYLTELDDWVSSSKPPEALEATWLRFNAIPYGSRRAGLPLSTQIPVFDNTGNTSDAASFSCKLSE